MYEYHENRCLSLLEDVQELEVLHDALNTQIPTSTSIITVPLVWLNSLFLCSSYDDTTFMLFSLA